jgi:hypothetical protein
MNSNIFDRKFKIVGIMCKRVFYKITDCRTLYTDLDLISEEEFFAKHPEYEGLDGHELMLKRLEDEAEQRVELETRRKELAHRRAVTQTDNKKRKNDLDNLTETLKKFIEVSVKFAMTNDLERHADIRSASKVLERFITETLRRPYPRYRRSRFRFCRYTLDILAVD